MSNTEWGFLLLAAIVPLAYYLGLYIGVRAGRTSAEVSRRALMWQMERAAEFRAGLQAVRTLAGNGVRDCEVYERAVRGVLDEE